METSLHRTLKERFGPDRGGRAEVVLDGFRADAVGPDGSWVEVQTGPLGPLRPKLRRLLATRRVVVIKPVVVERRIVRRDRVDGPDLSARRSPRRGTPADAFDDLIGLAGVFPHPNLRVEVLAVAIDEVRLPLRRWPGFAVADRRLREVLRAIVLERSGDLWRLIPPGLEDPFTTLDLADLLALPIDSARRVAYCLRLAGAAEPRGKRGNRIVYTRPAGSVVP